MKEHKQKIKIWVVCILVTVYMISLILSLIFKEFYPQNEFVKIFLEGNRIKIFLLFEGLFFTLIGFGFDIITKSSDKKKTNFFS